MSDMLSELGPYFIVPELTGVGLVSNILHITLVRWYIDVYTSDIFIQVKH
jgi:hypothetical protein